MDVLITPAAGRDLEAFRAFRPTAGAWAILVGHRRGPRTIVEKVASGGSPEAPPDDAALARFDAIWPGRIVGLAVARPGAAFKRAVRGPAWCGRIILSLSGRPAAPALRAQAVAFDRRFFLEDVRIATAVKEDTRE